MQGIDIPLKRSLFESTRRFDAVLEALYRGIGTPDVQTSAAIRDATDLDEA